MEATAGLNILEPGSNLSDPATDTISTHPLLNFVILRRLFEVCPLSELKQFRLVCRLWSDTSLHRWRREITLKIKGNYGEEYGRNKLPRTGPNWNNVLKFLENVDGPSFTIMRMEKCNIFLSGMTWGRIGNLFEKYGPWLRKLIIDTLYSLSPSAAHKGIFEKLPNLEVLVVKEIEPFTKKYRADLVEEGRAPQRKLKVLTFGGSSEFPHKSNFPFTWNQVFTFFLNIETLSLQYMTYEHINEVTEALRQLRSGNQIRSLTLRKIGRCFPRFSRELSESISTLLELPQLRLKRLSIDLNKDKWRTILPRVILNRGLELEIVHLDRSKQKHIQKAAYHNFPFGVTMVLLTELVLYGPVVANLHFLEWTPSLKTFRLELTKLKEIFTRTRPKLMMRVRLEHLRRFEMNLVPNYCISKANMKMIVGCMPNVTRFQGKLNDMSFRILCKNWKGSLELNLGSSTITEKGITGIVTRKWRKAVIHPNLLNLKCLRKFSVISKHLENDLGCTMEELDIMKIPDLLKSVQQRIYEAERTNLEKSNRVGIFRMVFHALLPRCARK